MPRLISPRARERAIATSADARRRLHSLVARDLVVLVDHFVEVPDGDFASAGRRFDEVDELIAAIIAKGGKPSFAAASMNVCLGAEFFAESWTPLRLWDWSCPVCQLIG